MDMKLDIDLLKQQRDARAWTQSHLADVSGVSLRTIQRIEKSGIASQESTQAICAAFDLKVEDLLQQNITKETFVDKQTRIDDDNTEAVSFPEGNPENAIHHAMPLWFPILLILGMAATFKFDESGFNWLWADAPSMAFGLLIFATVIFSFNQYRRSSPSHVSVQNDKSESYIKHFKYKTFIRRVGAKVIDVLLLIFVLYYLSKLFGFEFSERHPYIESLQGLLFISYIILMHGFYGQTIGKMLAGVKVIDRTSEKNINVLQALIRESVIVFICLAMAIIGYVVYTSMPSVTAESLNINSFIDSETTSAMLLGLLNATNAFWTIAIVVSMLINAQRRSLNDLIGRTVVVRV